MLPGTAKGANMTTTIQTVINEQHGFIKQSDLPGIIEQVALDECSPVPVNGNPVSPAGCLAVVNGVVVDIDNTGPDLG